MTAPRFHIVDKQTGKVVGKASTLKGARRSVDRRDNAYGCYNFRIIDTLTAQVRL
jgi:hypothetical protein